MLCCEENNTEDMNRKLSTSIKETVMITGKQIELARAKGKALKQYET